MIVFAVACAIWREHVMPWWVAPETHSFYIAGIVYATMYGACMSVREATRKDPPADDDELLDENYEHPVQPIPILLDFIVKIVLTYVIQGRIINRVDLDTSQHVSLHASAC